MLVFAVPFQLNFVAFSGKAPNTVPFVDVLLDKAREIESDGDNLLMDNFVLQFPINKVVHVFLNKYLLDFFAVIFSDD